MPKLVAFAGGGTGGHIYPGLAVAEELKRLGGADIETIWIGSSRGIDRGIVEGAGMAFVGIPSGKLRRYLSLKTLTDAFRVLAGYFAARAALKRLKPALLFSKGGYVSVPPVKAAKSLGIPVFAHESDMSPGLATRLNAGSVDRLYVSYEETALAFTEELRAKIKVSGQPVRPSLLAGDAARARAYLDMREGQRLLLVMGGSQGAAQINEIVEGLIERGIPKGWFILHQTGQSMYREGMDRGRGAYKALPYIGNELADYLACADMALIRAGAGGLWECAATNTPMILVPLEGGATRGDQVENAAWFEKRGGAITLRGAAANAERVAEILTRAEAEPAMLSSMGESLRALGAGGAAAAIAHDIMEAIK